MTTVIDIRDKKALKWAAGTGRYVYVGRPSFWGNPYTHLKFVTTHAIIKVSTVEEAVARYAADFWNDLDMVAALPELIDCVLGCFCLTVLDGVFTKPYRCHAAFLADEANKLVQP